MKIFSVVGARPQFIKAATICRAFVPIAEVTHQIIHTGQHYDKGMSDIFFSELEIDSPSYNLGINSKSHGAMTGKMLEEIETILQREKPDLLIVYGDTNSTLAGALAAAKLNIPVAHIEAGLRSYNRQMPEEINRIVADDVAELLYAPTLNAQKILLSENKSPDSIYFYGDIMLDAALHASQRVDADQVGRSYQVEKGKYCLCTLHRAENTDNPDRLLTWFTGLEEIARETKVILPLHPRTSKRLKEAGKSPHDYPHIQMIKPIGYLEMVSLTKNAKQVITDSGGLQKEAYFHKVPCLILRNETEWIELVESKWSQLVKCNASELEEAHRKMRTPHQEAEAAIYGNGDAALKISQSIIEFLNSKR
ncbi:MAG: UDP-N-acetylglucosamine 2-epimerase (non-hydrolyzing) [Verrucomicrobiota bacterium]